MWEIMLRLTKKMEDGSYQANNGPDIPGENSYDYKDMIIKRCGLYEDFLEILYTHIHNNDSMIDVGQDMMRFGFISKCLFTTVSDR